jgi:hypothetical protein
MLEMKNMFEYRADIRTIIILALFLLVMIIAGPHTAIVAAFNSTAHGHMMY